jgi:hypothetical protein
MKDSVPRGCEQRCKERIAIWGSNIEDAKEESPESTYLGRRESYAIPPSTQWCSESKMASRDGQTRFIN